MSYFIISLSFCLLECVMVVVSFEPHSQIKGNFYIIQWIILQITFQKERSDLRFMRSLGIGMS